jgi:hypothetical protein
MSFVS